MKEKKSKSKKSHDKKELETEKKNVDNNNEKPKQENNINKNDINEKDFKGVRKKQSPLVFIQNNNLQGFHMTFILMIIIPISVFFIIRNILKRFNFSSNQQDVYGVIGVLISVWAILVSYIIYYFRNDFYLFFCKKNEKDKKE